MELDKWVKSTRSGNNGQSVELLRTDDGETWVKDSKDPDSPVLKFRKDEWDAFLFGAKHGQFD